MVSLCRLGNRVNFLLCLQCVYIPNSLQHVAMLHVGECTAVFVLDLDVFARSPSRRDLGSLVDSRRGWSQTQGALKRISIDLAPVISILSIHKSLISPVYFLIELTSR